MSKGSGGVNDSIVEVRRGDVLESRHRVHVAVVDGRGSLRAYSGDAQLMTIARSAVKPVQALPLVEDGVSDRYEFTDVELALCCASHNGESRHVEAARSMLRKIGADEDTLACGPHVPMGARAARALADSGRKPGRIHNNCSGKHAGMLALARYYSWPLVGYERPEHPVQLRMLSEVSRWSHVPVDDIALAVDGCAAVTFGLPLSGLARAFANLAAASRRGESAPERIVQAMVRHPAYVAGEDRMCTDLMRAAGGRIFAKVGAEGVYCAGIPGAEIGVALKIEDGATRAAEPALIAVLKSLTLLSDEEIGALERYAQPDIVNTRDERVGNIRAHVRLQAAS